MSKNQMRIKLTIRERSPALQPVTSEVHLSGKAIYTIGRENSDVILKTAGCSRRHAELFVGPHGQLGIRDLQSKNGTFVRGERVDSTWLQIGDEITVKSTRIEVNHFYTEDSDSKKSSG